MDLTDCIDDLAISSHELNHGFLDFWILDDHATTVYRETPGQGPGTKKFNSDVNSRDAAMLRSGRQCIANKLLL